MSLPDPAAPLDIGASPQDPSIHPCATATETAIREALAAIRPGAAGLSGRADLAQEADLDSVGVMDLVVEIEDRLDLSIPVETIAQARTLDELLAGVLKLQGIAP